MPNFRPPLRVGGSAGRSAVVAALILFLATSHAAEFDPDVVPSWVKMYLPQRPLAQKDLDANREVISKLDGAQVDLALYGDSNTAMMRPERSRAWEQVFPPDELLALPLGLGGSTMEELAYRILEYGEGLVPPPRVAVLLCGYNNLKNRPGSEPDEKMDWLIQWLQHNWPATRLALSALLPSEPVDVAPASALYQAVAERRGVLFFDCNAGLDPSSKRLFTDGVHLATAGQLMWLDCMREVVSPLLLANSTDLADF